MYKVENSVLNKDGKAVFLLGQSYYPSFHHGKFPVPPDGDRMGEMKKDLKMMRETGFNHVRFAAIGNTAPKLLEAGAAAVAAGASIITPKALAQNDYKAIQENAKAHIGAVRGI